MTGREFLVIGEALIDVVQAGNDTWRLPGGSPTNVAVGLARLGNPVTELTCTGDDADGYLLREHIRSAGVRLHEKSTRSDSSSIAKVSLDPSGDASYEFSVQWSLPGIISWDAYGTVHAGSLALAVEPGASALLELLRNRPDGVLLTIDPNVRAAFLARDDAPARLEPFFRISDLVKLSEEDAAYLYPDIDDPDGVLEHILAIGPQLAAITLGERGAIVATTGARRWVPALASHIVDTIGAGDSFMAALIDVWRNSHALGDADGETLRLYGERASRAAAITVMRAGADLPWRSELDNSLHTSSLQVSEET